MIRPLASMGGCQLIKIVRGRPSRLITVRSLGAELGAFNDTQTLLNSCRICLCQWRQFPTSRKQTVQPEPNDFMQLEHTHFLWYWAKNPVGFTPSEIHYTLNTNRATRTGVGSGFSPSPAKSSAEWCWARNATVRSRSDSRWIKCLLWDTSGTPGVLPGSSHNKRIAIPDV